MIQKIYVNLFLYQKIVEVAREEIKTLKKFYKDLSRKKKPNYTFIYIHFLS